MVNDSTQNLSVGNFSVHPNVEATFPQGPVPQGTESLPFQVKGRAQSQRTLKRINFARNYWLTGRHDSTQVGDEVTAVVCFKTAL